MSPLCHCIFKKGNFQKSRWKFRGHFGILVLAKKKFITVNFQFYRLLCHILLFFKKIFPLHFKTV